MISTAKRTRKTFFWLVISGTNYGYNYVINKLLIVNLLLVSLYLNFQPCLCIVHDPQLIVYPGDVNIALIVDSHKSSKPGVCSDSINSEQLRATMTALWTIHQINTNRANKSSIRLGLYVYDTCSDIEIAERQVVRLLSHLDDLQSTNCAKDNREGPLIGVVSSGDIFSSSLHLLSSFQVPIISTRELDPMYSPKSSLFTVAPSLKHLSKAVVGLLNKLNWSQATLVVSDEVPLYYTKILEEISLKVRFNVQNSSPNSEDKNDEKPNYSSSSSQHVKNTILFLSPDESLKLFTSLKGQQTAPTSDYDWIVVTSRDIRSELQKVYNNHLNDNHHNCQTKPMYLILPQQEKLPSIDSFLHKELQLMGDSSNKIFNELLATLNNLSINSSSSSSPPETLSSMIKAISTFNLAINNYESKYCDATDSHGNECIHGMGSNLVSMIMNEIKLLNDTIDLRKFTSLHKFRINFDDEHYLTSNRYALLAISPHCQLVDMGFFVDGILINGNQERSHDSSSSNDQFMSNNLDDSVKALQSSHITLVPSESSHFESERMKKPKSNDDHETAIKRNKAKLMFKKKVPPQNVYKLTPIPSIINVQNGNISSLSLEVDQSSINGRSTDYRSSKYARDASKQPNLSSSSSINPLHQDIIRRRYTSFFSWLGWAWTVAIVSFSAIGILVALYTFTYILMKSCEGALKKSNQDLATFHLLSVIIVYFSSVLYIFPPSVMMCSIRASLHNISLIMLFASLFQRGLNLRAQKWIGLGGKSSKLNQCFTVIFIIGIQVALEVQRWSYEEPWLNQISTKLTAQCSPKARQFVLSQAYLLVIVLLLVLVSFSARTQPFAFKDGKHIFFTSMLVFPIYLISIILIENYTEPDLSSATSAASLSAINSSTITLTRTGQNRFTYKYYENMHYHYANIRDIISSISMILMATTSMLGIFGPIIYTIHKYGILPPKNSSYAESLSTAFTLFRGLDQRNYHHTNSRYHPHHHHPHHPHDKDLLEQTASSGLDSSSDGQSINGKLKSHKNRPKNFFTSINGPQLKFDLKSGARERSCPFNHCRNHFNCTFTDCNHLDRSGLIRNPLYDDKNFRSAYP